MPVKSKKANKKQTSEEETETRHADPTTLSVSDTEGSDDAAKDKAADDDMSEAALSSLSNADVNRLRNLSVKDIQAMDDPIAYAIDSFFENRIQDCETALRDCMAQDPLAVTGAGLIAFVRCVLSMEQAQADIALGLLTKSSALAVQVMNNNKGAVSQSLSRVFQFRKSAKDSWLTPAEFRAKTIQAESQALRCFVLVLQQSVSSVLKAGIALNKASSAYKSLYAELEQRYKDVYGDKAITLDMTESPVSSPNAVAEKDPGLERSAALDTLGLDRNSVHCVEFGLGAINLVVSLLPTTVRSMLRFIGVEGNRQYGLHLVRQCFRSNSLLSPFSSALLLALYGFLPSVSAFLCESYLPVALEVRQATLKTEKMRDSLLHLWLDGRIQRLTRDVSGSIDKLNRCLEVASNPQLLSTLPQLRDFVVYDQWFNYAIMHQWKRASRCLEVLSKTSKWANAYYQYTQASCLEMLEREWAEGVDNPQGEEDFELAELHHIVGAAHTSGARLTFCDLTSREAVRDTISQLYWEAAQRKSVTLGGKPNHHDQFVVKRMEEMLVCHGVDPAQYAAKKKLEEALEPMPDGLALRNTAPLPAYEMILLVGVAHQVPEARKNQMQEAIDQYLLQEPLVEDTPLATYVNAMRQTSAAPTKAAVSKDDKALVRKLNAALPVNYRVLCLCVSKALLLAASESKADREAASVVIDAVRATPPFKDRQWTLSYAQAFVLYEKAYIAYQDESRDAAESLLNALHKQYDSAHYFMHAKIDFKAHLASYELVEQKQRQKALSKA